MSMHHQDHGIPHPPSNMPPPRSPQIDPALSSLYPAYYSYQQQQPQHLATHHLLQTSIPSPSSQDSDAIGTPPAETMSFAPSNANGKRLSPMVGAPDSSRKKPRTDERTNSASPSAEKEEPKPKSTRGSRYVLSDQFFQRSHNPVHFQGMHSMSALENEMRGCRARASL